MTPPKRLKSRHATRKHKIRLRGFHKAAAEGRLGVFVGADLSAANKRRTRQIESVSRHRRWQATLDKEKFFDKVFSN